MDLLDLEALTEEERNIILRVLRRDEELRQHQENRVSQVKQELLNLRMNSVLRSGDDLSKICARCKSPFGLFTNTGEACPVCRFKVCKNCRENRLSHGWMCLLCFKENQLQWLSGDWMAKLDKNHKSQFSSGTDLVRASLRIKRPNGRFSSDYTDCDNSKENGVGDGPDEKTAISRGGLGGLEERASHRTNRAGIPSGQEVQFAQDPSDKKGLSTIFDSIRSGLGGDQDEDARKETKQLNVLHEEEETDLGADSAYGTEGSSIASFEVGSSRDVENIDDSFGGRSTSSGMASPALTDISFNFPSSDLHETTLAESSAQESCAVKECSARKREELSLVQRNERKNLCSTLKDDVHSPTSHELSFASDFSEAVPKIGTLCEENSSQSEEGEASRVTRAPLLGAVLSQSHSREEKLQDKGAMKSAETDSAFTAHEYISLDQSDSLSIISERTEPEDSGGETDQVEDSLHSDECDSEGTLHDDLDGYWSDNVLNGGTVTPGKMSAADMNKMVLSGALEHLHDQQQVEKSEEEGICIIDSEEYVPDCVNVSPRKLDDLEEPYSVQGDGQCSSKKEQDGANKALAEVGHEKLISRKLSQEDLSVQTDDQGKPGDLDLLRLQKEAQHSSSVQVDETMLISQAQQDSFPHQAGEKFDLLKTVVSEMVSVFSKIEPDHSLQDKKMQQTMQRSQDFENTHREVSFNSRDPQEMFPEEPSCISQSWKHPQLIISSDHKDIKPDEWNISDPYPTEKVKNEEDSDYFAPAELLDICDNNTIEKDEKRIELAYNSAQVNEMPENASLESFNHVKESDKHSGCRDKLLVDSAYQHSLDASAAVHDQSETIYKHDVQVVTNGMGKSASRETAADSILDTVDLDSAEKHVIATGLHPEGSALSPHWIHGKELAHDKGVGAETNITAAERQVNKILLVQSSEEKVDSYLPEADVDLDKLYESEVYINNPHSSVSDAEAHMGDPYTDQVNLDNSHSCNPEAEVDLDVPHNCISETGVDLDDRYGISPEVGKCDQHRSIVEVDLNVTQSYIPKGKVDLADVYNSVLEVRAEVDFDNPHGYVPVAQMDLDSCIPEHKVSLNNLHTDSIPEQTWPKLEVDMASANLFADSLGKYKAEMVSCCPAGGQSPRENFTGEVDSSSITGTYLTAVYASAHDGETQNRAPVNQSHQPEEDHTGTSDHSDRERKSPAHRPSSSPATPQRGSRLSTPSVMTTSHTGSTEERTWDDDDDNIDEIFAKHRSGSRLGVSRSTIGDSRESLASVYSDAGEINYGRIPVSGEIAFGLEYDHKLSALKIHLKGCHDLAPVDTKHNRSDPYVKVYLLPDKTRSGKRKSKIKKHTLNPVYNETLTYNISQGELENRTLWVTVWHSDRFGRNDFLGEVTIPMDVYRFDDSAPRIYTLQSRMPDSLSEASMQYKGDLIISLMFLTPDKATENKKTKSKSKKSKAAAEPQGEVHVLIKAANNLTAVRANGTSDPFVKGYLLPDRGKTGKKKTPVVKNSVNPMWNHILVFDSVDAMDLANRSLELTVWDHEKLGTNEFLGGVRLNLGFGIVKGGNQVDWMDARGEEATAWQSMMEKPNSWIDAKLPLRASMGKSTAKK